MVKNILVIDDDNDYVESVVNLLEAKGYSVDSASNGADGVAKAKENKPDLILLDVMMTTRDEGFNVARELNDIEDLKGTPVAGQADSGKTCQTGSASCGRFRCAQIDHFSCFPTNRKRVLCWK
ncbi:MAG: response regulator transcription factor [Planctomycetota bacterium]